MERIIFLDRATVDARFRAPGFPHQWTEYARTAPQEVVDRISDATIAVTNKVRIDRAALEASPDLRFIQVAATGVDIVDLPACRARGVTVANIRNYAIHTVPEHALMLMLALRRNLAAYREDVMDGAWSRATTFCLFTHPIADLFGARLGIIGFGALGRATAKLAEAFGMEIAVAEHKGAATTREGRVPFSTVLGESDVISLHAPLLPATRHLIGPLEFAEMKQDVILINTARGGLVDEVALKDVLLAGRIGGFGFDVLEKEPPEPSSPLLEIAGLPNALLTPHVAWASKGAMQRLADQLVDNLEAFIAGTPANVVT